jgi:hypothetical protein
MTPIDGLLLQAVDATMIRLVQPRSDARGCRGICSRN